jgi:ketosteroid isomerase-like protein
MIFCLVVVSKQKYGFIVHMTTEQQILECYKEWDKAIERNDIDAMSRYMSDEWICVGTTGITPKATFLESINCGDLQHTEMSSDFIKVKVYNDAALVVGRGVSAGTYKRQPFSLNEWSTSMFVLEGDDWRCVLTMLTPANNKDA